MKWEARGMTAHHKKWIAVIFERNATWIERINRLKERDGRARRKHG